MPHTCCVFNASLYASFLSDFSFFGSQASSYNLQVAPQQHRSFGQQVAWRAAVSARLAPSHFLGALATVLVVVIGHCVGRRTYRYHMHSCAHVGVAFER